MIFYFTSKDMNLVPANRKAWLEYLISVEGKKLIGDFKRETGVRTALQNNSLHLGLTLIAKTLNDSGLDLRKVLKPEVDIPWTTESAKEYLWRPIQKIMTGKDSTTKLDKVSEITEIWDVIMRHLGEKHHVEYIPFPHKEKEEFDTSGLHKDLEVPNGKPEF
jgi:hypothetical protein